MVQRPSPPPARTWLDARAADVAHALFPRVMEYKVISREREKHEFMPVVYVIDRSASWKQRVPRFIERAIVQAYISPTVVLSDSADESTASARTDKLTRFAHELQQRTQLLDVAANGVCTDESKYKLGVFVNYSAVTQTTAKPPVSELDSVVQTIATTLRTAKPHLQRTLIVPVTMHFCASSSVVDANRFAGIRYGAPVLLEPLDVATFAVDPREFVQHISARLSASLTLAPPATATQMEILRLTRTLHVYCAKVVRDDCFSRRQIASMNEELLQIHLRTQSHPDVRALKTKMTTYVRLLRTWRVRDEDINAAAIDRQRVSIVYAAANVMRQAFACPAHLLLAGASDFVYAPPAKLSLSTLPALFAAVAKCALAFIALGVLVRIAQTPTGRYALVAIAACLLLLHTTSSSVDGNTQQQHVPKPQFYIMDTSELQALKATRAVLARRIHALVAQYLSTDLPQPVLQDRAKAAVDEAVLPTTDEYALNPHHKVFINAPRSFALSTLATIPDLLVARRVVFAPKMLRDETWRTIYESVAPPQLRLRALLASNKGDNLPMTTLLETPLFRAVLSAYIVYIATQQQQTLTEGVTSDEEGEDKENDSDSVDWQAVAAHARAVADSSNDDNVLGAYGDYGSADAVIDAALQLAQEEDELSS